MPHLALSKSLNADTALKKGAIFIADKAYDV
jgi:hypothetical protein